MNKENLKESPFKKYELYILQDGKIVSVNKKAFDLADESYLLFKSLYDTVYGSIDEDENLISIHTGGWSENEYLISEFKKTSWWFKHHQITIRGGHYYFNTDTDSDREWRIAKTN